MLKVYNTLTRKKENFVPLNKGKVGIYSCGPTVYSYAHIGNLRTYIFNDIFRRSLEFLGYKVKHVMNITDIDDKTIKASQENKESLKDFTKKYEKAFLQDISELNIITPIILRATDNISGMVDMISKLLEKGYAYKTEDGIYFSVDKSKDYGKLVRLGKIKKTKQRISSDEYDKNNIRDFALWKLYSKEDGNVFYDTKIGKGRPGWHIECSVMSTKSLGDSFDIHTGALDLKFPHHTNEIAQSEAATGKKFVKYWIHSGFLNMKDGKMSKSLGNILTLKEIRERKFDPLDFRYLTLTTHYRKPLYFSIEKLDVAKTSYQRLRNIISEIKADKKTNKEYLVGFEKAIEDDFNIPEALQVLWGLVRDSKAEGKINTIKKMDEVFGLDLLKKEKVSIPIDIKKLVSDREKARKDKSWEKADALRKVLTKKGYSVEDTSEGSKVRKL